MSVKYPSRFLGWLFNHSITANVEVYQADVHKKYGTKFAMPVTYNSQLMTVTYGGSAKEAGLDGHIIQPKKLQELAAKK